MTLVISPCDDSRPLASGINCAFFKIISSVTSIRGLVRKKRLVKDHGGSGGAQKES